MHMRSRKKKLIPTSVPYSKLLDFFLFFIFVFIFLFVVVTGFMSFYVFSLFPGDKVCSFVNNTTDMEDYE